MFDGFLALGGEFLGDPRVELINSTRAATYVRNWNKRVNQGSIPGFDCPVDWLVEAPECPEVGSVFENGDEYFLPSLDPAPWYDVDVRGSERFFGMIGLEVTGDEDLTRTASVRQGLSAGGFVGHDNHAAREVTVRALALAADECGLSAGLEWMRGAFANDDVACAGSTLWFLTCCPECDSDNPASASGPCWPATIGEMSANAANDGSSPPGCVAGTWWPATMAEFVSGPPPPSDPIQEGEWCAWVEVMNDYKTGLPEFACGLFTCVGPYIRQFRNVRIINGPTVVKRTEMNDGAFIAEVEFVVVAADPFHYGIADPVAVAMELAYEPNKTVKDSAGQRRGAAAKTNPFALSTPPRPSSHKVFAVDVNEWNRQAIEFWPQHASLPGFVPDITLEAIDSATDNIRVGVWDHTGKKRLGGWLVKHLPVDGAIRIDGASRSVTTRWNGEQGGNVGGAVVDFGGRPALTFPTLESGTRYIITIDTPADGEADFTVNLSGVGVSA